MVILLSLPNETLGQIVDNVDNKDLLNVRRVCKALHNVASRRFGTAYFTNRHHALSEKSISALLEIVAHPGLGPCVKSINLSAIYPLLHVATRARDPITPFSDGYKTIGIEHDEAFVNSREYTRLMKQIMSAICKNHGSVQLKVSGPAILDGETICHAYGWSELMTVAGRLYEYCAIDTLGCTILAAIRANCTIRSLVLELHHYDFDILQDVLEDLLSSTRPALELIINCTRRRYRRPHSPYTIIYDQATKSIKLRGMNTYELSTAKPTSTIKKTLTYLFAQGTTHLELEDCHLCSADRFIVLLSLTADLESVHIHDCEPCRSGGDWALFYLSTYTDKHEVCGGEVIEHLRTQAATVARVPVAHPEEDLVSF
ncbi:hypothetical protein E4T47_07500 [Aureobasidium subglaciale]|nr:hypothetical protein E4T47_07500 [Aureobasidium subglaciale]